MVRAFAVLEAIAVHQPIGVSELARMLVLDKNAVQRAIVSLAELGWIAPAPGRTKGWELTAHIFAVAYQSHSKNDLRLRAKVELDTLRNETGETVLLTVPDLSHFIVADVYESRQVLRTTPGIGTVIPVRDSSTGQAILPYLDTARQVELLGGLPDRELAQRYAATLERGYSVCIDTPIPGVTSIASPVFEAGGTPCAAVVVISPNERLPIDRQSEIGSVALKVARSLSRGRPAAAP